MREWILSSDCHLIEPPDLWSTRLDKRFRDAAPCVKRFDDGDWWVQGDYKILSYHFGSEPGKRFEGLDQIRETVEFGEVMKGGYLPEHHLREIESDGVYGSVLYPSMVLMFMSTVADPELLTALCGVYNEWAADFCAYNPKRLKGVGIMHVDDIGKAVTELQRIKKLGLTGVMIPVDPGALKYDRREYDPLWAAAQDMNIPISLHAATNRVYQSWEELKAQAFVTNMDHWVRMAIGYMIFGGVFERFPKLKVLAVEHELGWIPHFIERMDYTYTQRKTWDESHKLKPGSLPSDYWYANCYASFQEDPVGIRLRDLIGVDNLMWGSDYPHIESTYPRTREILDHLFEGVSPAERRKILFSNARDVFGFEVTE